MTRLASVSGWAALTALLWAAHAPAAVAQERYALVVTGAPGGEKYAEAHIRWEAALVTALTGRLKFDDDRIVRLGGGGGRPAGTAEAVRAAVGRLRRQVGDDDLLLVVLMGHGSVDEGRAKFNLVGPDLEADDWAGLLNGLPGQVVVVNTTGASFPFLARLAARGRVVITATGSVAERYDTVFPEAFVRALDEPASDLDKNGRVSVWEIFVRASEAVRRHYEQRGLLATERAVIDDDGDGVGQEADQPGMDGALARATYLERPAAAAANPALGSLLARQRALEEAAERLKLRKGTTAPEVWAAEFEALMIELARVSRRIRSES